MMDFEAAPETKEDAESKKSTRPANGQSVPSEAPPRAAASSTRKPLPTSDGGKSAALTKDQPQSNQAGAAAVSSTSTTSAAPAQPSSKKRKAGTQGAATSKDAQGNAPSDKASSSNGTAKKAFGTATVGFAETNMMSFDNCKALTQDNTLTADDGTTLTVNGECTHEIQTTLSFFLLVFFFFFSPFILIDVHPYLILAMTTY